MTYRNTVDTLLEAAANMSFVAPLYVERQILNPDDLLRHLLTVGYSPSDLLPPEEWHVTQVYSRTAVEWLTIPAKHDMVTVRGKTSGQFGDTSVVLIESPVLQARFAEFAAHGASWDYPTYQPHVSVGKDLVRWGDLPPYTGKIMLGPERFARLET